MAEISNLEWIAQALRTISDETNDRPTNWRGEQASLAFAKVGITCMTFLRLIPGSTYFSAVGADALWDLSAAASQCRALMEAYYLLCYLIYEPANENERIFRQALWDYHEERERWKMLSDAIHDSKHIPAVEKELLTRRTRLESCAVFGTLSNKVRKRLIEGRHFRLESMETLSRKAGISERYYKAQYRYCSAFVHSAPFALSQLRDFKAGDSEAKGILDTLVSTALAYSVMAIRDFTSLFPDQLTHLDPEVSQQIEHWKEVLQWEQSKYF